MFCRPALLLLALSTHASACMCADGWPSVKQAWQEASFVFLGTVEVVEGKIDASGKSMQGELVRIHVDEAFKGVANGQAIELNQRGDTCETRVKPGQHAVFYIHAQRGSELELRACFPSVASADPFADDLLFLRGLPQSAAGTRLSGSVEQPSARNVGVPNVTVRVTGNGISRQHSPTLPAFTNFSISRPALIQLRSTFRPAQPGESLTSDKPDPPLAVTPPSNFHPTAE